MLNYVVPMIEYLANRRADDLGFDNDIMLQIQRRRTIAQDILGYLNGEKSECEKYFSAVGHLLRKQECWRLLLYLPLADLKAAPYWFHDVYMDAWYSMLNVYDVRENFFEGDTFEVDARPGGRLERVVKCAHLAPWLIEAKYLGYSELRNILLLNQENEVLLRSFANTWRIIKDLGLLTRREVCGLKSLTMHVNQRERIAPLYISEKRQKWLQERESHTTNMLLTPNAELAGPFSLNVAPLRNELEAIQAALRPDEIALVGGSRLKGYGVKTSDLDVFWLRDLESDPMTKAGNPHAAHIYFDMLWLGGGRVANLEEIAAKRAAMYFKRPDRAMALERLESDLLQYRLLHKGFARFYGEYNSAAKGYKEMDGDCPFYDDKYRSLATKLFVKYVFIPYR